MERRTSLNCLLIFLVAVSIRIIPATLGLLTADACMYLDIARNLASQKGLYIAYNLYDSWLGLMSPSFYSPPFFPVLLAIILKISQTILAATLFNVFLCGFNAVILYLILQNIYQNQRISFYGSILSTLCLPAFLTSIHIWSEQLHLLTLLLTLLILFRKWHALRKSDLFIVGIITAFGYLSRIAGVFNLFAFMGFILLKNGFKRDSFYCAGTILLGFLVVIIPYQLLSVLKYNMFYPQYPAQVANKALFVGGYFDSQSMPVLKAFSLPWLKDLSLMLRLVWERMLLSLNALYRDLTILVFFIFVRKSAKLNCEAVWKEYLLIIIAVVNLIAVGLSPIYWADMLNAIRLNIIPCVLLIPVGVASLYYVFDSLNNRCNNLFCFYAGIIFISIGMFTGIAPFYDSYFHASMIQQQNYRRSVFSWIRSNSTPEQRIGLCISVIQEGYELDRPVVCLPDEKLLSATNVRAFIDIYRPQFVVLKKDKLFEFEKILSPLARRVSPEAPWNNEFIVYKPNINTEGR